MSIASGPESSKSRLYQITCLGIVITMLLATGTRLILQTLFRLLGSITANVKMSTGFRTKS